MINQCLARLNQIRNRRRWCFVEEVLHIILGYLFA